MEIEKQQHKNNIEDLKSSPSSSSSPSHEFSFTISLHSSSTPVIPDSKTNKLAIDLSPADDIFFHGHLLPLHLLSHFPVSPRSSTNSLDSFTLPILEDNNHQKPNKIITSSQENSIKNGIPTDTNTDTDTKSKPKPKSFSLFGWRKGCEIRGREEKDEKQQKKKQRFDQVSHILKRYIRMVRPLLFFKGRRENHHFQLHNRQQPYNSFSGNLSFRNKQEMLIRGRRGEYSAPASMRTSPTNSGLLVASTPSNTTSDSTMEELQAAIQAAIAHCKNSIAAEDKIIKC